MRSKTVKMEAVILLTLMAAGLYLRVEGVSRYYLSADEALIVNMARGTDFLEVIRFSLYETHPPLMHILLHYWQEINGTIDFARYFSLLPGMLLIPLYYAIGTLARDRVAGLSCAALAAFSYGLIIQAFIIRSYSLFTLCISLMFYCYLAWRKDAKKPWLTGYMAAGTLASLIHFSSLFVFFTLCLYELLEKRKITPRWLVANAIPVLVTFALLLLWHTTNSLAMGQTFDRLPAQTGAKLLLLASYPFQMLFYILTPELSLLTLIGLLVLMLIFPHVSRKHAEFIFSLKLCALALGLGGFLLVSGIYANCWTRHSLWLAPFMLTGAGISISVIVSIAPAPPWRIYPAVAILALIGICGYDRNFRFFDVTEYDLTRVDYKKMEEYLAGLDNSSIIIASRDSMAARLVNTYPYLKEYAYTGEVMAAKAPYQQTHILFNPFYRFLFTPDILLKTISEATYNGMLEKVETLVFMFSPAAGALQFCAAMPKEIVELSQHGSSGVMLYDNFRYGVRLIKISKKDFFAHIAQCSE